MICGIWPQNDRFGMTNAMIWSKGCRKWDDAEALHCAVSKPREILSNLRHMIGVASNRRGSLTSNSIEYSDSSFWTALKGLKSMRRSNSQWTRFTENRPKVSPCHGNPEGRGGTYSVVSSDSGYRVWHGCGLEGSPISGEIGDDRFTFSDLWRTIEIFQWIVKRNLREQLAEKCEIMCFTGWIWLRIHFWKQIRLL
jgi:hypothetical protein